MPDRCCCCCCSLWLRFCLISHRQVTNLSGYLYKFSKDERRAKLQEALAGFSPPRQDLYVPTNPEARVKGHIPSSGACMQSAAKVCGWLARMARIC
jgi:hypothetical protein